MQSVYNFGQVGFGTEARGSLARMSPSATIHSRNLKIVQSVNIKRQNKIFVGAFGAPKISGLFYKFVVFLHLEKNLWSPMSRDTGIAPSTFTDILLTSKDCFVRYFYQVYIGIQTKATVASCTQSATQDRLGQRLEARVHVMADHWLSF